MSDSSTRRSVIEAFWRPLQVALITALVGIILFVGLTRTQVGRSGIRHQIESTFNGKYRGTLSIGSLNGTIVNDLVATDIRLRDSTGQVVVAVDSIVAEPRWANLLTTELLIRSLTIVRPHLTLHRDSTGTWNFTQALQPRRPSPDTSQILDLTFAEIQVQEGRLTTTRSGRAPPPVQNDWTFDYTQTTARQIALNASVRQTDTTGFVALREASFSLPNPNVQVSSVRGEWRRSNGGWSLDQFALSLDTTRIQAQAALRTPPPDSGRRSLRVQIQKSRLDNDELRRLFPRLPLADLVTVQGQLQRTDDDMSLRDVTISREASSVTLDGTLSRSTSGMRVDASLTDGRLAPSDVRAVWPGLPEEISSQDGPVRLEASVQGTTPAQSRALDRFDVEGALAVQSPRGAVAGSLAVRRSGSDSLTYDGAFRADSLNLGPLTDEAAPWTRLNGTVNFQGQGPLNAPQEGEIDLALAPSRIGEYQLASADGQLSIQGERAQGTLTLRQATGGTLYLTGSADRLDARPLYSGTATASDVNLAADGSVLPSTRLNAQLTVQGGGTDWQSLTGTTVLKVDSSRIYRGDSTVTVPPHSTTLRLSDRAADRPRLEVSGSLASLTVDGTTLGPPLWATARRWGNAFRDAVRRELDKPAPSQLVASIRPFLPSSSAPTTVFPPSRRLAERTDREALHPIEARAHLRVHRSDLLHAWWPDFPNASEEFEADATLRAGPDSLHAAGSLSAAFLRYGPNEAENLAIEGRVSSHFGAPLAQTTEATAEVSADRIGATGPSVFGGSLSLSYGARSGTLHIGADSLGILGSIQLASALHITPERNELRLQQASFEVREREWTTSSPASIVAYSDAIRVTPLVLQRSHPQRSRPQRVRLSGTVSSRRTDTLSLTADNVYLPPFSQALDMSNPIGGNLTGQLHLQSGYRRPALDGDLSVRHLSYDRRLLGDFRLQAAYSADRPDLRLDASLVADTTSIDRLTQPVPVPNGARTVNPNNLRLSGHIRLPKQARLAPSRRPSKVPEGSTFDLNADVNRADLFFFQYIFEEHLGEIQGYATGGLHIGGRFYDPIFDADLSIENGFVTLPLFGLEYEASGPVRVDRRGIHPRGLMVQDEGGSATVDGSILFNDYEYFSFDLSASLDELTVIDVPQAEDLPFYGTIRASGPATLTGPLPDATLRSSSARTTPDSELFIPVSGETVEQDRGFIVFADSTGRIPNLQTLTRRENILADRPEGVPSFVEGLNLNLNIVAPEGSTVNLVFDPIVGDIVTVNGSGRVQIQRKEGNFSVFGSFTATGGTYLFTAGEVFVRRFSINEGTIRWDGDPTNAQLDLDAEYRTRASPTGLPGYQDYQGRIPVTVQLDITGRVATPSVDLSLSLVRDQRGNLIGSETLDAILNQPARRTEYATSVLLTNTFLLTTESLTQRTGSQTSDTESGIGAAGNQLAFNSVSQLVSSQLNRYLGEALPNVDLNFGVQGEDPNDLDLIYGVALRLLNERLLIRGEGVYTGDDPETQQAQGPQGEFVVEVRLSSSVSAEVFYRRTGDEFTQNRTLTSSRGAGLSYQTEFSTWRSLLHRLFGWLIPFGPSEDEEPKPDPVAEGGAVPPDSSRSSTNQPPGPKK